MQFPDTHHEATATNLKCTLNILIKHHFTPKDIHDYKCLTCGRRTLATKHVQMSCYPVILCIEIGCKMNDETRITSAVDYPVINFNLCTFLHHMKERWTRNTTSLPPWTTSQVKRMMAITRRWKRVQPQKVGTSITTTSSKSWWELCSSQWSWCWQSFQS